MAIRGRKPNVIPTTDWKVWIPVDLAVKFDLHHIDPLTGKVPRGVRSDIVTGLIRQYLREQGVAVD